MKYNSIVTFHCKGKETKQNKTKKIEGKVWSRLQEIIQQLHVKLSSDSSWSLDFSKY